MCGDPLSRYACRSRFPQNPGVFFRCSSSSALQPPYQGRKIQPKKPPTPINPTENSLRKQFAQTLSACLLFNLKERGRTICTNSPENCLRKLFSLGWVVFEVGFSPLTLKGPVAPVAFELPGVSHVKLPLKRCRATGGVAATLAGVALHCATETAASKEH